MESGSRDGKVTRRNQNTSQEPRRRLPAVTPRATLAATAVLWPAALALFAWHLLGALPIGALGTDLWCAWLLAIGCVGFWTTFLRVTNSLIAEDWQAGVALGDLTRLPLGDPSLDGALGEVKQPGYVRAALWPIFGAVGFAFWALSAGFTVLVGGGYLQPHPSDALLGLVCLMIPAVQCTAAAVNGPGLSRQYTMRKAAALAHQRLRQESRFAETCAAVSALPPESRDELAERLTAQREQTDASPLRLVNGDQGSQRPAVQ